MIWKHIEDMPYRLGEVWLVLKEGENLKKVSEGSFRTVVAEAINFCHIDQAGKRPGWEEKEYYIVEIKTRSPIPGCIFRAKDEIFDQWLVETLAPIKSALRFIDTGEKDEFR